MTLRPITGRQVVVRTEATNLCYSNAGVVLGLPLTPAFAQANAPDPAPPQPARPPQTGGAAPAGPGRLGAMALIQGHGGVGVVEAVGPEVRRVRVGDRVCVSGTPQCAACYQCLRGRSDMCQFLGRQGPGDLVPMADLRDGVAVAGLGATTAPALALVQPGSIVAALATTVVPLDGMRDAYEQVAYRTTVTAIMTN
jgi:NADPH:quinone reductase-like Zn-dependent oxidoreductase